MFNLEPFSPMCDSVEAGMDLGAVKHGTLFRCSSDGMAYIKEAESGRVFVVKARHFGATASRFHELGLQDGMRVQFRLGQDGRVAEAHREAHLHEAAFGS